MSWLRPTFEISRGSFHDLNKWRPLRPVRVAVLQVDTARDLTLYEVLGSGASPAWVPTPLLAGILRERGEQL